MITNRPTHLIPRVIYTIHMPDGVHGEPDNGKQLLSSSRRGSPLMSSCNTPDWGTHGRGSPHFLSSVTTAATAYTASQVDTATVSCLPLATPCDMPTFEHHDAAGGGPRRVLPLNITRVDVPLRLQVLPLNITRVDVPPPPPYTPTHPHTPSYP